MLRRMVSCVVLWWCIGIALPSAAATAAGAGEPASYLQQWDLYKTCQLSGIVNHPDYPECAFATPPAPAATDFMDTIVGGGSVPASAPLVGVTGTIIDAATIANSMNGGTDADADAQAADSQEDSTLSSQLADEDESDPQCHNGIYSDGCEEGGRTLHCTFVPPTTPIAVPWEAIVGLLPSLGLLALYRSHFHS